MELEDICSEINTNIDFSKTRNRKYFPECISVSLEYAKKLKQIGVEQESIFYWYEIPYLIQFNKDSSQEKIIETQFEISGLDYSKYRTILNQYSAFTAQELLDLSKDCFFNLGQDKVKLSLYFQPEEGTDNTYTFTEGNLADLFAQMLIAKFNEQKDI
jgi:hypothetical protein